jgi:radical SAM protein with 4Fe4S-binding SPASM domain
MTLTARGPDKLTLILTHRCNQRCEFCFDATNIQAGPAFADMPIETVDRVLDKLRESVSGPAAFNVTLSGGEPTLHSHFLEIVRRISHAGFPVTILSNGQRFADRTFMEEVLSHNIWNLQFSIEGPTAELHDQRVGRQGAWALTVRAIENARDCRVRFITNTTMTRSSVPEMFAMIDLLDELGVVKMNIGNTLPECAGRNWRTLMEYPEVVEIAEQLTLYALSKRIAFSFITPLPHCLKADRVISNPSVCSAGRYSIVVETDGTYRPCSVCNPSVESLPRVDDAPYGQIHDRLDAVVEQFVRTDIPQECRQCSLLSDCKACCPLYWKVAGVRTPSQWNPGVEPLLSSPRRDGSADL